MALFCDKISDMQETEKKFLGWSLGAFGLVLALLWLPGLVSNGVKGVKTWWQERKPAEEEVINEPAEPSPLTGIIMDGEDAGREVDMSGALLIVDLQEGTGREAKVGDTIRAHYVGTLMDGTVFDSSRDRGEPFEFTLGAGQVIKGWDDGIVGMKEGGQRRLTIPPEMAYGDQAVGKIPANSTLNFEVELVEIL